MSGATRALLERQLREQGHADGRTGRPQRWPLQPAYRLAWLRGRREYEARTEGAGRAD